MRKGDAYSLVFEESRGVRARVRVAGGVVRELYSGAQAPLNAFTKVTAEYDATSGKMQIRFNDNLVAEESFPPAPLAGTNDLLTIGGIGVRPACGEGINFAGTIDEVSISRIARHLAPPDMPGDDASVPDGSAMPDSGGAANNGEGGGCCDAGNRNSSFLISLLLLVVLRRRPSGRQPSQ
jgi:hypothetical protein